MGGKYHLRAPPPKPSKKSGVVEVTFCSTKLRSSVKSVSISKNFKFLNFYTCLRFLDFYPQSQKSMPEHHFLDFLSILNCFEILNVCRFCRNIKQISNIWKKFSVEQSTFGQNFFLIFFSTSKNHIFVKIYSLEMRYSCKT